jgi:acid phosphatase
MPYLNSLAATNGLATQFFADAHPSLPNYFSLTVGAGTAITGTQGDSYPGPVTQDNIVRALTSAGKTWRFYGEALPQIGYLGPDTGAYVHRHNPFAYLSDVVNSPAQAANMVPFTQFGSDVSNSTVADYSFIVPDLSDDAHDCPSGLSTCSDTQKLANADQWLKSNIDPLIKSPVFKNSLLIITFDEGDASDAANGGGHVATFVISPKAKAGYQSTMTYQHESILRLTLKGLGVSDLPGAAATAPDMGEFFQ